MKKGNANPFLNSGLPVELRRQGTLRLKTSEDRQTGLENEIERNSAR